MDGTDLLSLETNVRDLVNENDAKFWTQGAVFRAVNEEVRRLTRRVISLDSGWFETVVTPTPAATYVLPTNCYLLRNVQLYIGSVWVNPTWIFDHGRGHYQNYGTSSTYPYAVRIQDSTIHFENGVGDASQMRVNYARMPAKMRYEAMAAGGTTSFTMGTDASVVDDVYIGDQILTLDGTSSGDRRIISDYVGSTKVATISVAFTTTTDTTTLYSTLLPDPLEKYPDVVALGAAIRLLGRRRDDESVQRLRGDYERDLSEMMDALDQRQTQTAERGNFLPDWGDE